MDNNVILLPTAHTYWLLKFLDSLYILSTYLTLTPGVVPSTFEGT